MAGIVNSVKQVYGDLTSGTCKKNFNNMSFGNKFLTVLKVAGIALAAGIIAGFLGAFGGSILGTLVGVSVMAVVGIAAFAYFTSQSNLGEQISDCANKCIHTVKRAL